MTRPASNRAHVDASCKRDGLPTSATPEAKAPTLSRLVLDGRSSGGLNTDDEPDRLEMDTGLGARNRWFWKEAVGCHLVLPQCDTLAPVLWYRKATPPGRPEGCRVAQLPGLGTQSTRGVPNFNEFGVAQSQTSAHPRGGLCLFVGVRQGVRDLVNSSLAGRSR